MFSSSFTVIGASSRRQLAPCSAQFARIGRQGCANVHAKRFSGKRQCGKFGTGKQSGYTFISSSGQATSAQSKNRQPQFNSASCTQFSGTAARLPAVSQLSVGRTQMVLSRQKGGITRGCRRLALRARSARASAERLNRHVGRFFRAESSRRTTYDKPFSSIVNPYADIASQTQPDPACSHARLDYVKLRARQNNTLEDGGQQHGTQLFRWPNSGC